MASSLSKGLDLIEVFDAHDADLTLTELGRRTRLPLSTVHRLLATLIQHGFIRQNPATKRYTLSVKFWEKGCLVVNWHGLTAQARPYMEEINRTLGETVTLGVMEDGFSVYIDEIQSLQPIGTQRYLGRRVPGHASATGKAILAHRPDEIDRVLAHGLAKFTERTITRPKDLARELTRVRQQGYSVNRGAWLPNVVGIAAPVRNHSGRVIAAVSVSSPSDRMPRDRARRVGEKVAEVAARLSKELGWVPGERAARPGRSRP